MPGAEVGEFNTREDAERTLDEVIVTEPSAAQGFAVFELDENGKRVGEPITRAAASRQLLVADLKFPGCPFLVGRDVSVRTRRTFAS